MFLSELFGDRPNMTLGGRLCKGAEEPLFAGCSKMPRCKAPEIVRSKAYI
jgi:hypothetical protein